MRTTLTAAIGGQSLTTTTTYDADGRASSVQDPLGRAYPVGYDAASNRTTLGYPNTTATSYGYDVNNRLTNLATVQTPTGGGAPLTVQSFAYTLDGEGKRTQIVEADGTVRQYGYDAIDRLTSEAVAGPLTYAKAFTYDAVGNRLTQVTTGTGAGTVPYTYDSRDRMLTSDGSSYTYDANGNELTKSGEAIYSSNLENRLANVAMINDTSARYTYDADGNRVQTVAGVPTACTGNSAVYVGADTTTQGNWIGKYGADGESINSETAVPPAYGSLTVTNSGTSVWASSTSEVQALQDPPPGTSRIGSEWYTSTTETFGVVTSDHNLHTVALYMVDWNTTGRTQSVTAVTPTGTVLSAAVPFTSYGAGVYAVYTVCGDVNFNVTYTGGGGNSSAVVSGVFFGTPEPTTTVTNALVDTGGGLSQVVGETDGSGNPTALYVRAGDQLLAVMRPGTAAGTWATHFVHSDGLGSVRAITDEGGAVVDTRGYEAFGTKNVEAGSETLAYGFAGEALDSTTKLAYHRARWMDSRVGRFTGMDRIDGDNEQPITLHRYAYADDEPADQVDPSGNDAQQMNFFNFVGVPNFTVSQNACTDATGGGSQYMDSAGSAALAAAAGAGPLGKNGVVAERGGFIYQHSCGPAAGRYSFTKPEQGAPHSWDVGAFWTEEWEPKFAASGWNLVGLYHTHPSSQFTFADYKSFDLQDIEVANTVGVCLDFLGKLCVFGTSTTLALPTFKVNAGNPDGDFSSYLYSFFGPYGGRKMRYTVGDTQADVIP